MLDFDLAEMYGMETKRLKEAVRRNIERFPDDFMFELTKEESVSLRSQIATSNRGGSRYQPFAFTKQGVAMLSSILNSKQAIEINIRIMRAFVVIRQLLSYIPAPDRIEEIQNEVKAIKAYIEEVFTDYNDINEDIRMQLELINQSLAELQVQKRLEKPRKRIGFVVGKDENE
jgi:phage regulator Rha-like protein